MGVACSLPAPARCVPQDEAWHEARRKRSVLAPWAGWAGRDRGEARSAHQSLGSAAAWWMGEEPQAPQGLRRLTPQPWKPLVSRVARSEAPRVLAVAAIWASAVATGLPATRRLAANSP